MPLTRTLYVPGYFEVSIKKGESIIFAASTKEIKSNTLKTLFQKEYDLRQPRDNFYHCLVAAAHQFHFRDRRSGSSAEELDDSDDRYLLAGYPWFKARARDTFIALPGLTLAIGEQVTLSMS